MEFHLVDITLANNLYKVSQLLCDFSSSFFGKKKRTKFIFIKEECFNDEIIELYVTVGFLFFTCTLLELLNMLCSAITYLSLYMLLG